MAKPYVTGPAHTWVGLGANYSPVYLGTTERTPKIVLRPSWEPVFNDLGGKVPFDVAFEGEEGFVSGLYNRFNEVVYAALAARPNPLGLRGTNFPGHIGTLMITEGMTYPLWLVFPYAAKPAYADMPAGYRFLASYVVGPDELEPLGTTPRKIQLIWHCLRAYAIDSNGNTIFTLYDHNITNVPSVIPTFSEGPGGLTQLPPTPTTLQQAIVQS